jgi:YHS domain-containing protein
MNSKKKNLMAVLLVAGFVFVGLTMLSGCKDEEPAPQAQGDTTGHEGHDHGEGEHMADSEMAMATDTAKEIAETEQTMCPVMTGNKINKQYSVEYKGKTVYFCCPGCDEKFLANPEKYVANLPQFK